MAPRRTDTNPIAFDLAGSVLFVASGSALAGLFGFIASSRFAAPVPLLGVFDAVSYAGYLWNLFGSRFTARFSLRRGIVAITASSAAAVAAAAAARSLVSYALPLFVFLAVFGLFAVQYNNLIPHLYREDERPRRLSGRYFAISAAAALLAPAFGLLASGPRGHLPAFLLAAVLMLAAAAVFGRLPTGPGVRSMAFTFRDVARVVFRDRRFRRVAIALALYGWVGAGGGPVLVLLYRRAGCDETGVGVLAACTVLGTVLGTLVVTPRIRFQGGVSNFRLCFSGAFASFLCYAAAALVPPSSAAFVLLGAGNALSGVSDAGFMLAVQTTALNLAPAGGSSLYVNSLMSVIGIRGVVAPLLVAGVLAAAGLPFAIGVSIAVTVVCALLAFIPPRARPA